MEFFIVLLGVHDCSGGGDAFPLEDCKEKNTPDNLLSAAIYWRVLVSPRLVRNRSV